MNNIQNYTNLIPKLIFLCGLPASGKSTWIEKHKEELNFTIHSSDNIRAELLGDVNEQSQNELVFKTLHSRVREDLLNGKNVIMDQTGLNRKKRMAFLNQIQDIPCEKICVLFATPYGICLNNNENRDRKVPEEVIDRMVKNFEVPAYAEDWDDIQIVWWDWKKDGIEFNFNEDVELWRSISHDSKHHSLSIGDHMIKAWKYMCKNTDDLNLQIAAFLHDCGKIITKAFINSKGELSESAHYYEHHNASSYISLFYLKDMFDDKWMQFKDYEILFISLLINMHMRPFLAWKDSKKSEDRDRRLFGDDIVDAVLEIHEADLAAH